VVEIYIQNSTTVFHLMYYTVSEQYGIENIQLIKVKRMYYDALHFKIPLIEFRFEVATVLKNIMTLKLQI